MLYSKVDVHAFATANVAVALCSLVIKGTHWRSQKLWMGERDTERVKGVGCEEGCG